MKKMLPMTFLFCVLLMNIVNAGVVETGSGYILTETAFLKTTLVSQDPYPADPGSYLNLLFKIENLGTEKAENVILTLIPEYPFSLDPGLNGTKELGTVGELQRGEKAFFIKYRLRVDKDALDGENEIKVKLSYDGTERTETFNVTVSNPRTDFDVVVQDFTTTSATLAIANIGANTAYSVIVKIPEQENFRVRGTSANVVGNLDAGDYTFVTFQITPTRTANVSTSKEKNLVVEISYTDLLGIRRNVQKEVKIDMSELAEEITSTQITRRNQVSGGNSTIYIMIGLVGIIIVAVIFKFMKRKKK